MGRIVYSVNFPWVRRSTFFNPISPPDEDLYLDPQTHSSITAYILKWCAQRKLIEPLITAGNKGIAGTSADMPFRASFSENIADFSYQIYNTNMRSLLISENLKEFVACVADNRMSHNWKTDVQQLIVSMTLLYGDKTIDALINRIYNAYQTLPVSDADLTWADIHRNVPIMWVLLLIHESIVIYVDPPEIKRA